MSAEPGLLTLQDRLRAFWAQQPDEELTVRLLQAKLPSVPRTTIVKALRALQQDGWLSARRDDKLRPEHQRGLNAELVFYASPELREALAAPLTDPGAAGFPPEPSRRVPLQNSLRDDRRANQERTE